MEASVDTMNSVWVSQSKSDPREHVSRVPDMLFSKRLRASGGQLYLCKAPPAPDGGGIFYRLNVVSTKKNNCIYLNRGNETQHNHVATGKNRV